MRGAAQGSGAALGGETGVSSISGSGTPKQQRERQAAASKLMGMGSKLVFGGVALTLLVLLKSKKEASAKPTKPRTATELSEPITTPFCSPRVNDH